MRSWIEQLKPIIEQYKGGDDSPLDGDDVSRLWLIIEAKMNLDQGNITEDEYERVLDLTCYKKQKQWNKENIK